MAFDFPNAPTQDQIVVFADGSAYQWTGETWKRLPDQPPPAPRKEGKK